MSQPIDLRSLPVGHPLSDYRIEGVLGQGGFGITYLAIDTNLGRKVAIKEYYPREFAVRDGTLTIRAAGNDEDRETFAWGRARFLEEARILARFEHPNIIAVRRFLEANGTAYLVMDYCDGEALDEIIKRDGPLSKEQLNGILFPMLDGLEQIHRANFLHRDIKPANLYIRADGSPVLLDFGAARQEIVGHSRSVTSLATPGYAAFEQYSTKGKQGPWTDIYGLGATLYRAVTGEKPQDSPDRMLEDTLEPAANKARGHYPENLLAAIDVAMAVRPDQRPQSIAQWRQMMGVKSIAQSHGAKPRAEQGTDPSEGLTNERTSQLGQCPNCYKRIALGSPQCECGAQFTTDGGWRIIPIQPQRKVTAIWNPNASACWSLIFTPAFGSYLQMLNWRALGEPEMAKSSRNWFYSSIVILLITLLADALLKGFAVSDNAGLLIGFFYLLIWYSSHGIKQSNYVKETLGKTFQRKPWSKALSIGLGGGIFYNVLAVSAALLVDAALEASNGGGAKSGTHPAVAEVYPVQKIRPFPISVEGAGKDCAECPAMVVIPAGSFTMGSPDSEASRDSNEGPLHQAKIARPFSLGKFEITRREFEEFVTSTGHATTGGCRIRNGKEFVNDAAKSWRNPGFSQTDEDPVVCVNLDDAMSYIKWLSKIAKRTYRLPSEAEWEYAARAGSTAAYSFGSDVAGLSSFAWFRDNNLDRTQAVGKKLANRFGLYDMHGNVWEWTEDCWNENYNNAPTDGSAWTAGNCSRRVVRGGSWSSNPQYLRAASRNGGAADIRSGGLGFRVARTD